MLMMCPNVNSKDWQELVARQGEAFAHLAFQASQVKLRPTTILNERKSDLYEVISEKLDSAPDYYVQAYRSYGYRLLGKEPTLDNLKDLFYVRASSLGGTLKGDTLEIDGKNYLLFPEAEQDFKATPSVDINAKLQTVLMALSGKTGIPFVVINDPNQKFKGRYINQGEERLVVINTAYAENSTPLHEYYHPFVRLLKVRNPRMFDQLLSKAAPYATGENMDSEELVTEYLSKLPEATYARQRFVDWIIYTLKKVFGLTGTVSTLSTIGDVVTFLSQDLNAGIVYSEKTLTKADSDVASILNSLKNGGVSYKFKKDTSGTDYITEVLKLAKEQDLTTDDASIYYRDNTGKEVAMRLTSFVGDREQGEFSVKWRGKKFPFHEFIARQMFKSQGKDLGERPVDDINETILLNGQQVSFQDVLKTLEKEFAQQRVYGKMVHAFIQYKLEQDPNKKAQAKAEAVKWAIELGTPFATLETHPELLEYENSFDKILAVSKLKLEGVMADRVSPEITIASKIITDSEGKLIGTTIDSLIQHHNNDVSLLD